MKSLRGISEVNPEDIPKFNREYLMTNAVLCQVQGMLQVHSYYPIVWGMWLRGRGS